MLKKKTGDLILIILNLIAFFTFLVVLIAFNNLDRFLQEPNLTPAEYLATHPYIEIDWGSLSFIWSEPSSTILVYGLGLITIVIGIKLVLKSLKIRKLQSNGIKNAANNGTNNGTERIKFVEMWGISLIIWGIGTLLAGTSYQAFFYELKCRGQEYCLWTTWWEIGYLALTVISVNGMVVAQSYLRPSEKVRTTMKTYAGINLFLYFLILIFGMLLVNQFLISFEMMVVFQLISFVSLFIQNIIEYRKKKEKVERSLIWIWIFLAIVMAVYFGYYFSGVASIWWSYGIWFNANDILHVGLIGWMLFIYFKLIQEIK